MTEGIDHLNKKFLRELIVPGYEARDSEYDDLIGELISREDGALSLDEELEVINIIETERIENKIAYLEELTHIPYPAMEKYLKLAQENEAVLSFRDPGLHALIQMKKGATGKGYSEKGKSSTYGINLAGLIPEKQEYSKAAEKDQAEIYNVMVQKRLFDSELALAELKAELDSEPFSELDKLPVEKQDEIVDREIVVSKLLFTPDNKIVYGVEDKDGNPLKKDGSDEPVFVVHRTDGTIIDEETRNPYIVLEGYYLNEIKIIAAVTEAYKQEGKWKFKTKNITADHDQLFIGSKAERGDVELESEITEKFGEQDKVSIAVSKVLIDNTRKFGAVKHAADSGAGTHKDSLKEEHYGILSESILSEESLHTIMFSDDIIALTSKKIGGNPFPEDFTKHSKKQNYTFIIPSSEDSVPEIRIASNQEEITVILNEMEVKGFNTPINARYGWSRDRDDKIILDEDRISAQKYINFKERLKLSIPSDKYDAANNDSNALYKLHEIRGLVRLQKHSKNKENLLKIIDTRLDTENQKFYIKYGVIPPTLSAISNKEVREKNTKTLAPSRIIKSLTDTSMKTSSSISTPTSGIKSKTMAI